jgi:hypothetical protein
MKPAEITKELSSNFHLFWDNFPFPVMLVRKDRTIVDLNKAGQALGCAPGLRCSDIGKKEDHKGCLANQALLEQSAQRVVAFQESYGMVLDSYWVPLAGEEDLYLHFSIDITDYAAGRLFPNKGHRHGDGCGCGTHS